MIIAFCGSGTKMRRSRSISQPSARRPKAPLGVGGVVYMFKFFFSEFRAAGKNFFSSVYRLHQYYLLKMIISLWGEGNLLKNAKQSQRIFEDA